LDDDQQPTLGALLLNGSESRAVADRVPAETSLSSLATVPWASAGAWPAAGLPHARAASPAALRRGLDPV